MSSESELSAIVERVRASPHQRIKVAICDIDGVLRGKYMHRDKFISALTKGFGFCDVVVGWDSADECYDNVSVTGWHSGYPDAPVRVDVNTERTIPWDDDVLFFLGDLTDPDGVSNPACPRSLLRQVIDRASTQGFSTLFGLEFEWFNFAETPQSIADKGFINPTPITPGMFGYSILRSSLRKEYFSALFDQMAAFKIPLEGLHTETGPGVYEAAIQAADALEAADRGALFKTGAKEIAYQHGCIASFMARWNTDLPGCSGHIHQSLWDPSREENVFFGSDDPNQMSDTFKHYLAGQMLCMPEILPMFAPTVNSYKRLVEGFWAPTRVTWGVDNRTVAMRVIPGSSPRLETRVSGSDINPYLGVSAALASGLYGIANKIPLEAAPVKGSGYEAKDAHRLPSDLASAAERMGQSSIARELFGDAFVDHFVASRLWECRQFHKSVTDWELKRYLEII